jgi:hypothetical protein
MKTTDPKFIETFIEAADPELVEDLVTSYDIDPDALTWKVFYPRYQRLHLEKYGEKLTV